MASNTLCDLADLKAALNISSTLQDRQLQLALRSATRSLQKFCGRTFFNDDAATPRVFTVDSPIVCHVDDISTTSGLIVKTDDDDDGVFETTWAASDYVLEPLNGIVDGEPWPYTSLRAVGDYLFPRVPSGRPLVQVTAKWGWPSEPPPDMVEACLIQATKLFKAVDAPFGAAGFGEMGAMRLSRKLHPDAEFLADPFRLVAVGVG